MDKVFTSLAVSVDGFIDEVILHQVPVLLGHGRRFFQELPTHIGLSLVEAVPAPGVTHLRYRIEK
jgi:dihydrofolate reductase